MSGAAMLSSSARAQQPDKASLMPTLGKVQERPLPVNAPVSGKYQLANRFGLGGVALGNGFAPVTDELSEQAMEAAWNAGVRYFDTSPFYGYGLSERRMGRFLHNQKRNEYVISTKIGRIFKATEKALPPSLWKSPSPFEFTYDYTADGVKRSIEDSLNRLGISSIDIVFIHDLSPDNFGEQWKDHFAIAEKGAMPELTRLRDQGVIKAWGFGVNRPEPALRATEVADPDLFLLATQYSLLDHKEALEKTFPVLEKAGTPVVVGAPILAGFLAGRERYLYGDTIPAGAAEKRKRILETIAPFGVDLKTVSLQFAAAPKIVCSVIPGARSPEQIKANVDSMKVEIPAELWQALKKSNLIESSAPAPS